MSNTGGWYSEGPVPKEPKRLGDVLGEVARGLGLPDPKAVESIARAWPSLVGEAISAHSRPRSLRDGVLTIAVDSPVWGTQLRYLEADVVQLVGTHASVTSLRVVVDTPL
jgi:predicted nucleic acid-binding Zn ribbon protein